jgi:riboflavin kinase / FMN adenylyltransferase
MKVTMLPDAQPRPRRLAVGMFDGVHLGHRRVIEGSDTVLTFDPHPVSVVAPHAAPKLLTSLDRKAQLVASLGVEELVVIPFDHEFAARSAESFIDDVLVGTLGATRVAVGENFRFGHKAQGDTNLLRADGRFAVHVEPLHEVDGEIVSSSHIRGLVLGGAVEYADQLLGAPFVVAGPVVQGDARGRRLGFPTANLVPQEGYVCPGHGVYACRAYVNGAEGTRSVHPAAVNVGVRPMFITGRGELIEAYLIDFEGDLYGRTLEVEFLKRLRGEKRFDSVDTLIDQMGRDVEAAQAFATVPRRS